MYMEEEKAPLSDGDHFDEKTGTNGGIKNDRNGEEHRRPLSASWREDPLSLIESGKVMQIIEACNRKDRAKLVTLASTEDGFVEDEMRRRAWPILLGTDSESDSLPDWQHLPPHRDEPQVALDVNRAFVYYPKNETDQVLDGRKTELSSLILCTLRRHPTLNYFQGYHDIAQVLLLVLGSRPATPALARLSLLRIRDFMLPTLVGTNSHLDLLPAILYAADPSLCTHLSGLQPYFALAATLTMFAHDIEVYASIARLFDFLLARDAVVSVYMFAVIVMSRKDELLEFGPDEPEMLYAILSKLPKPLDLEKLIAQTVELVERFPSEKLPFRAWSKVSRWSVLKTTRVGEEELRRQTLGDGEIWLQKQAVEIERNEARKVMLAKIRMAVQRYKRPAGALTVAVLIAVFSYWVGRTGNMDPLASAAGGLGAFGYARQRVMGIFGHFLGLTQR